MAFDVQLSYESDLSGSLDDKGYRTETVTRNFTIVSDTPSNEVEVRIGAAGLPRYNDPHPLLPFHRVNDITISQISPIFFESSVQYASPRRRENVGEDVPNYELPVEIDWSSSDTEEPVDEDYNGNPIVVPGTREPIEGLTRRVSDLVGTFKKNMLAFDPASIIYFKNTVNADTFLGFSPGIGMLTDLRATARIDDNVPYWEVTGQFTFRVPYRTTAEKTWYKRVKCQGFYELSGSTSVHATDGEGNRVTTPVLLAADGTRLADGADPVWLEFQIYGTSAFTSIGFV